VKGYLEGGGLEGVLVLEAVSHQLASLLILSNFPPKEHSCHLQAKCGIKVRGYLEGGGLESVLVLEAVGYQLPFTHLINLSTKEHSCHLQAKCGIKVRVYLEGGGLESVLVLEAVGHQLALAHVVKPVQLTARMLSAIECCEPNTRRTQPL
jgi:hypothetical protein